MQNILNEIPSRVLSGRLKASVDFVSDSDIKNKVILDIGCGFGWCEMNFLKRGVSKIVGLEISKNDLKTAKAYVQNPKVDFKVASAVKLPFKDESFDTVVCWEVIEHLPKRKEKKMFSEVSRVLKDEGIFYLSAPHSSFFSNILDPAWWLIGHRHYKTKRLERMASADFKVLDVKILGGFWSLMNIVNMYLAKWIFRRGPFFKDFFNKKENAEYKRDGGFVNIFIKFKKI